MWNSASITGLMQLDAQQLREALEKLVPRNAPSSEKIRAVEAALKSPVGQTLRETMAQWIVTQIVPVERLVPEAYASWRPPVRDAMQFVVAHLSAERLAPKLVEQIELPADTPAEQRLLRLIAKVPGLQKLGQVIARNQHLRRALRKALAKLENGIRDVDASQIGEIISRELGSKIDRYSIRISSQILKEASVSAVVRFSWRDPSIGKRQRGIFKVLKPHISAYFAEDMQYLQALAQYFGQSHHRYGFAPDLISDTFRKVRRLLRHEVNFRREQSTLAEAAKLYCKFPGVRIPRVIEALCTQTITALSEERGIKVTSAALRMEPAGRRRLAQTIVEALVAVPLLGAGDNMTFHGDPHAGNLLYDNKTGNLAIIDWALRERLTREQRRHLAVLFFMVMLRDPVRTTDEVLALTQSGNRGASRTKGAREQVRQFFKQLPPTEIAGAVDAMRLLERVAMTGLKFPPALIMLSKVMFTLDGLLHDIAGENSGMSLAIARHMARYWISDRKAYRIPLRMRDWVSVQGSAILYASRLGVELEQAVLDRLLRSPFAGPGAA